MPKIRLFNTKTYYFRTDDPIIACNNLYKIFTQKYLIQQKKNEIVRELNKKRKQAANYIKKSEQKLSLLRNRRSPEEIANIINTTKETNGDAMKIYRRVLRNSKEILKSHTNLQCF